MSHDNTPHACFKAGSPLRETGNDELSGVLEHALRARFDSVRVIKTGPMASLTVVLQTAGKSFSMVLGRSKYEDDEWILLVGPPDGPSLLDRLRGQPLSAAPELILTCHAIHEILTELPGISAVRWYFEGLRTQTAAVATPDELPWSRS
jgi:hypothetical protein